MCHESDANPLEIATYYLACHRVEEAIDVLCQNAMFREAVVLAKCRFMENDNSVFGIMEKWAKHALLTGNFEAAALW